jgi:hypothetical protein
MANTYDIGDGVTLTSTFSVATVNTDPTTVTLRVKDPGNNIDVYTYGAGEITKSDVGIYTKAITLDECGRWYVRWEGTGTVIAAEETYFEVRESKF